MKTKCPHCSYKADSHTLPRKQDTKFKPKSGDYSFCINCGEVNQYTKTGIKKADIDSMSESCKREVKEMTDAWLKMKAQESVK